MCVYDICLSLGIALELALEYHCVGSSSPVCGTANHSGDSNEMVTLVVTLDTAWNLYEWRRILHY